MVAISRARTPERGIGSAAPPRRWRWRGVAAAGGTAAVAVLLAACGSSGSSSTTTTAAPVTSTSGSPTTSAPAPGVVDASTVGTHGVILVTKTGVTLYRYTPDGTGAPTCTGGCATAWPPLTVPAGTNPVTAGSGVTASDLGTVARSDGSLQVTYKKMPLYTFAGDSAPGQANGQGVGGIWFVVPATATTSATGGSGATTTTTKSGYGY
jgi:predicted lipoprotein with Yx(FWY)xxD motif